MNNINGVGFSAYINQQIQRANTNNNQSHTAANSISEVSDAKSNTGNGSINRSSDYLAEVETAIRNSHSGSGLAGKELNKELVKAYSLPLWLSSYTAGEFYNNKVGVSLENGLYSISDPVRKGRFEGVYNLPDDQRGRYNDLIVSNYYGALRQSGINTPEDYVNYLYSDNKSNQIKVEELMKSLISNDSELMSLIKTAKELT